MRRRDFIALFGGVAAAWPLAARAQQPDRKRRVAVLMSTASDDPAEIRHLKAFVEALSRLGWVEGRNLEVMSRWGDGEASRMIANARELVGAAPDAILVKGANVPAARQATSTIPIVFVVLSDAIAQECVGSFARPTGNLTGFTSYESALVGKRLTLLREMSPGIERALYLRSRLTGTDTSGLFVRLSEDARTLQMPVIDGPADSDADIERTILSLAREPNSGLIVAFDAFTVVHQAKIVELAARFRLPAIYPFRGFPQSGGLFSYGFDQDEQFRHAASYIARILAGEKPANLPVQTPIRFELVINLKTAQALGVNVPLHLQQIADELIE